jgi:hypothetical protein
MSTNNQPRGNYGPEKQRSRRRENPINKSAPRLSGDLLLMAAFIGVSRALFGSAKPTVQHADAQVARGRSAQAPSEIPAKGWMDIAWRVPAGFQSDRVMLVAAGVTFYALLALFRLRRRLWGCTGSSRCDRHHQPSGSALRIFFPQAPWMSSVIR